MNLLSIATFAFCAITCAASSEAKVERRAGAEGHGGSVTEIDGKVVPTDLVLPLPGNALPSEYRPVTLQELPGVLPLLNQAIKLMNLRSGYWKSDYFSLKDLEFFFTENLSVQDPVDASIGTVSAPVASTYVFLHRLPDFSEKTRRIVELKASLFLKLSVRHQALIILHELLHHYDWQHPRIAVLIQSMDSILEGIELGQDVQRPIPEKLFQASHLLQGSLFATEGLVYSINRTGGGAFIRAARHAHRYDNSYLTADRSGPGSYQDESSDEATNDLDLESVVIYYSDPYQTLSGKTQKLRRNKLKGSYLRLFEGEQILEGNRITASRLIVEGIGALRENTYTSAFMVTSGECRRGVFSRVGDPALPEWWTKIWCKGDQNHLEGITEGSEILLEGSRNGLRKVDASGRGHLTLGADNVLEEIEVKNLRLTVGLRNRMIRVKAIIEQEWKDDYFPSTKFSDDSVIEDSVLNTFESTVPVTIRNCRLKSSKMQIKSTRLSRILLADWNLDALELDFEISPTDASLKFPSGKTYRISNSSRSIKPIVVKDVKSFDKKYGK
jgi:hypothetical protein